MGFPEDVVKYDWELWQSHDGTETTLIPVPNRGEHQRILGRRPYRLALFFDMTHTQASQKMSELLYGTKKKK